MGGNLITDNPFAVLTCIVAPAILTNTTSVLAMSTINRMLRTRERMQQLFAESKTSTGFLGKIYMGQVNRVERQAIYLLHALQWIYTAMGAFSAASLITLLGAVAGEFSNVMVRHVMVGMGILLGIVGVTGLIGGCMYLLHATHLSLESIREEADQIRQCQTKHQIDVGEDVG